MNFLSRPALLAALASALLSCTGASDESPLPNSAPEPTIGSMAPMDPMAPATSAEPEMTATVPVAPTSSPPAMPGTGGGAAAEPGDTMTGGAGGVADPGVGGGVSAGAGGDQGTGGRPPQSTPVECDKEAFPDKPNLLFIITDDQAFDTIAAHGNSHIKTDNLDRLANEGVSFSHAYNQGSWSDAVCISSRAMFNTGKFVWNANKLVNNGGVDAGERKQMWSPLLKEAGYRTFMAGKWHVQNVKPPEVFDVTRHIRPGMPQTRESSYNRPIEGQPDKWSPTDKSIGGHWQGGDHWSEVLAKDMDTMLGQTNQAPFFMYLAFSGPHDPRQAPKKYQDMYPPDAQLPEPIPWMEEYEFSEQMGSGRKLRDERLAPFPRTKYAVKVHTREYYAAISHIDDQVGKMLDALEKSGKADNTYVIFTSDHGLAIGRHGLMGKQNMFEHSMRSPLIIRGPGLPAGTTIDTRVYLQDVMPTSLELSGAGVPGDVDFKSLVPLMCGEAKAENKHDGIYGAYYGKQRMVIKDGFKLIKYPDANNKILLYDLVNDPHEEHNLGDDAEHKDKITMLEGELQRLHKEAGG